MFVTKKVANVNAKKVTMVDNAMNVKLGTLVTLIAQNVNVRLNNIQKKPFVIMLMEHAIVWKSSTELIVSGAVMRKCSYIHGKT